MTDSRRDKLISLGSDALADALLTLAPHYEAVCDFIDNLISAPEDNRIRFLEKLARLASYPGFYSWRETVDYARQLEELLRNLRAGIEDPHTGLSLLTVFYEADEEIMEHCDDSGGEVGAVFLYEARDLFVEYASRCSDKEKIGRIVLELCIKDNYGVRKNLIEGADCFLAEDTLRGMIAVLEDRAEKEQSEYDKHHLLRLIESLARQIGDSGLFEKTRLASREELNSDDYIDMARVYYKAGDTDNAIYLLEQISPGESYVIYKKNQLLEEIYRIRGDKDELGALLLQNFIKSYTKENLEALLEVIGDERKDEILSEAIGKIKERTSLSEKDVEFLVSQGKIDEAEEYLWKRIDQISGDSYYFWPSIAQLMVREGRGVMATVIYRHLLESLLDRGYSKAYHHGANYLRALDRLAENIFDWKDIPTHKDFKDRILRIHGRKRSFWGKYNEHD